jgi:catechol 2,3-dioxygenase-like lactoylglutathione lyase family enzyme
MSAFRVIATNHTSFTVSDLDRTLGFFRDALGFEVTSRAPRDPRAIRSITGVEGGDVVVAYVRGPGHSLELIEYVGPPERGRVESRPCDVGFAHVAYDVDDIDAAIAASRPHGFAPIGAPTVIDQGPNRGNRVAYLRDPDGITVEFIEQAASRRPPPRS